MVQGTINIIGDSGSLPYGAEYMLGIFFIIVLIGFVLCLWYYHEKYAELKEKLAKYE